MEPPQTLRTPLYSRHQAAGARLGEVAGWEMPLSYGSPLEEVRQARTRAAVTDISHLGRIRVRGNDALRLLRLACTHDVVRQQDDTAAITLLCNQAGGIVDECMLMRLEDYWLLTTSAMNRLKVLEHLQGLAQGLDVKIDDQTAATAHIAVSGPEAPQILDAVLPEKVSHLRAGSARAGSLVLARYVAVRASYSGDWGLEVILPAVFAGLAWDFITSKAAANAVAPAGLAARDVMRIEAGLPAYGHELNETIDPVTAGLLGRVDLPGEFLGRQAIERIRLRGPSRKRAGLVFHDLPAGPGPIPRLGTALTTADGAEAGTVTSGTFSPTLDRLIALAYVATDVNIGEELSAEIAGGRAWAKVAELPLYRPGG